MVLGALRASRCANCQLAVLRSFTSLSSSSTRASRIIANYPKYQPSTQQIRRLSQGDRPLPTSQHRSNQGEIEANEDKHIEEAIDETQLSTIPWYLQVEPLERLSQRISERQQIPELPEAPPPILQPLLQQISVDLGLDDLSLLDLRKLDPPPALGANLLMVLGTARSEKHLHVSADRLCRWLRSEYQLRPDADGLLGRNELKLKLKRKAKRAKLMRSTADDNGDDGVRTGWVCVDVGVVDGQESEQKPESNREGFVGFGRRTDGVRIVVQMLTEEKREEIDLESLWGGILRRGTQQNTEEIREMGGPPNISIAHQISPPPTQSSSSRPISQLGQTRKFHSIRQQVSDPNPKSVTASVPSEKEIIESVQSSIAVTKELECFELPVDEILECGRHYSHLENSEWRPFFRSVLMLYLQLLPENLAISALGSGDEKFPSTPFLKCFATTISDACPTDADFDFKIWLHSYAGSINPGYELSGLSKIFDEMQACGVTISLPTYQRLLRACLNWPNALSSLLKSPATSGPSLELAIRILQAMYDQGIDVLHEDVFVLLQEAAAPRIPKEPTSTLDDVDPISGLQCIPLSSIELRLHILSQHLHLEPISTTSTKRLMSLYARRGNWLPFWDLFGMALKRNHGNAMEIYKFMFRTITATQNQPACVNVLRTWLPVMEQEYQNWENDAVKALMECLLVADPSVEDGALSSAPDAKSKLLELFRKVQA